MSPNSEITQQPQVQEMSVQNAQNEVVNSQPKPTDTMEADPEVSMRGGGAVGDCCEAICAFECCKHCC
ncbi:hypothetical protein N431DRAFT_430524 [Stipitochalara longipes BDJ]|nr:hypothetical protein N431DRAFT_430524 [Stipitochalara longipes BDJ]